VHSGRDAGQSQQPNQPKHEDGGASASGVAPLSGLQQPTPVHVATEQASYRHNRRHAAIFTASDPST
jgi:hypothetical protein